MSDPATHAAATERDLTISQLEAEVSRLTALVNASALVAASLDVASVLQELTQQAAYVLNARASSLLLVDQARRELVFQVAYGEKGADLTERRFPVDQGIAGAVATTGEPILMADARADPRHLSTFDEELGFTTGSLMAVPIQVRGQILGVLEVLNPASEGPFTEDDLSMLTAWAGQAGLALENASRHMSVVQQLELVGEHMRDGMVIVNASREVSLVNATARRMLGLPPRDAIGASDLAALACAPPLLSLAEADTATDAELHVTGEGASVLHAHAVPLMGTGHVWQGAVILLHTPHT